MTDQPIPVAEAIEAVQAAIAICPPPNQIGWDAIGCSAFCAAARAGYAATLEYLLNDIKYLYGEAAIPEKGFDRKRYAAVAPIVAWWRQSGAQGGKCSQCGQHGTHKMDCSNRGGK